ncbi:hypothetical protein [Methylopila sp. M107]|uniref:hypothetical protein n=1 Tax=Methylopila sp. M107 TaxID=1101190 RepID=UPI000373711E|nr:hypothetical protein [Methylopila sp. M107]
METVAEAAFKLAVGAIVFLASVVVRLVLEAVVQTFCYWTTRIVAPVVSLGYVSVDTIRQPLSC